MLDKPGAKWLGVCAGVADYTGIDVTVVRIATVVLNGRYLSRTALDKLFDRAAAIVKRYCGLAACCGAMSATRQHHICR